MANPQGIVNSNDANQVKGKHIHNYSRFTDSLSYEKAFTPRFGEYTPSFEMDSVPSDNISVNSRDLVDSLSLKAPFKGKIRKIKESFSVPNMAILPLNWDKIYTQPSNGDDVPKDANCVLQDFPSRFSTFWSGLWSTVVENLPKNVVSEGDDAHTVTNAELNAWYTALFRTLVTGEYIYSNGSLLSVCGYHAAPQFELVHKDVADGSYDSLFDFIVSKVFAGITSFVLAYKVGDTTRYKKFMGLSEEKPASQRWYGTLRSALEFFRENPTCWFAIDTFYDSNYGDGTLGDGADDYADYLYSVFVGEDEDGIFTVDPFFYLPTSEGDGADDLTDMSQNNLNLTRILAYQIVCAHYYSNSSIDVIYSADLYRQYVRDLYNQLYVYYSDGIVKASFSWNGLTLDYDFLSGFVLSRLLYLTSSDTIATFAYEYLSSDEPDRIIILSRFAVYATIFGYRKSLRFADYFVGSRPRPIAPINTDVSVNNSKVSVIDVTRSIQAQRFGNAVMRSRQKIEEYVKSLFGKAPAPDFHNPFYLSREVEIIFGDEVQNTGDAQTSQSNSRTALMASNSGRFTFTFHNEDNHPCTYIQIISFDIERFYTRSVDRQFLHLDRYDMFNPDFQYIGDQPIYGIELGYLLGVTFPRVFGYQTRDEEYKQRFNVASGGFVDSLPGWILTDRDQSIQSIARLDPEFIRSYNTELDQFYLSLTGFSLGHYYHFAIITINNVDARRPMAVDPQILA